jgi:23S rRNA maturation mini-RNase III
MRELENYRPSTALEAITGLLPPEIDAEKEFRDHRMQKHQA